MLKKWTFWLKAKNRHGVHSPFVYNFLDKGLYRKDLQKFPPDRRLLLATVDHFQPRQAGSFPKIDPTSQWLKDARKDLQWGHPPFDLMVFESPDKNLINQLGKTTIRHNETIVYVGNLRKDGNSYSYWREAIQTTHVRVVLETYHAGLLFFREQQARQHFRIRI